MADIQITRNEWMSALAEAQQALPEFDTSALTVDDFAQMMGLSQRNARSHLKKLREANKVILVYKFRRDSLGRPVKTPAYKLKKDE